MLTVSRPLELKHAVTDERRAAANKISAKESFVWALFGLGPSWMVVACIYQQVPAFERHLPEEYCIAAYLSLVISFSVVFVLANYVYMYFRGPVPHTFSVPYSICQEICAMSLAAAFWDVTINGHSVLIFVCAWLGGGVGGLQMVWVIPWMSQYKPICITAFRVGSSSGALLAAIVALIQKPGSTTESLFGPSTYFTIFALILILPVFAYTAIIRFEFGLRDKGAEKAEGVGREEMRKQEGIQARAVDMTVNPMVEQVLFDIGGGGRQTGLELTDYHGSDTRTGEESGTGRGVGPHKNDAPPSSSTVSSSGSSGYGSGYFSQLDAWCEQMEGSTLNFVYTCLVSCSPDRLGPHKLPWFKGTLPYMLAITWTDFMIFGLLFGVYPLAVKNATVVFEQGSHATDGDNPQSQEAYMGYSLQIAAVTYLMGDSLTFFRLRKLRYVMAVFTVCCFIVFAFASSSLDGSLDPARMIKSKAVAPLLVCLYSIINMCAPYMLTICFRAACSNPAEEHKEASARTLGLFDQASSLVGSVLVLSIVGGAKSCH